MEIEYKYYLFKAPRNWNLTGCFINIDKQKRSVVIDNPVDHCTFERCTSELLDGDDYEISELDNDDWTTKAVIEAGR